MKIVVGLHGGSDADYVRELAAAGADEFFLGYVPPRWSRRFGFEFSPNRRYRQASQVTSRRVLDALCAAALGRGRPVTLAFNEHLVTPAAWNEGRRLIREAAEAGVGAVIVADPSLIRPMRQEFPGLAVHVSGDAGLYNAATAELFFGLGAARVIFPREIGWPDLRASLAAVRKPGRQFEAFIMGEPCVYDGARCFAEHGYDFCRDFCHDHSAKLLTRRGRQPPEYLVPAQEEFLRRYRDQRPWELGKCGLCALAHLRRGGITHLKIPARSSGALRSVRLVRRMLDDRAAGPALARGLLAAPALCRSLLLCYYPELCHG